MNELFRRLMRYAPDGAGDDPGPGEPSAGNGGETPPEPVNDFDAWLKQQPATVQDAYAKHTGGLQAALKSERERRQELEKAERAKQSEAERAEADRLAKQGEYQQLAEKAQKAAESAKAKLAEVEPQIETLTQDLDRYRKALEGYAGKAREGLPEHLTALLDKMDPVEQLEYLTTNGDKLRAQPSGGSPGNNPARGSRREMSDEERRAQAWRPVGL